MLFNYFKIALRNLSRNKAYAAINVGGLAIGLACCLLILLFVKDELSYDRFHEKAERLYRVAVYYGTGEDAQGVAINAYRLGPALEAAFPELEAVTRISPTTTLFSLGDKRFIEESVAFADANFFEVFSFELTRGNPKTALTEPFTLVISERMAEKYFGEEDPIGKVVRAEDRFDVQVTGVMRDMPANSHMQLDFLVSMKTGDQVFPDIVLENWGELSQLTYLLLPKEHTASELEARFPEFIETHMGEGSSEGVKFELQPITSIHLHSHLQVEMQPNGDVAYVSMFSLVALFILLIACINYMNLATARSARRAREVGLRKVLGAFRRQLIGQFLGESMLMALLAMVLAGILAEVALPTFNRLADKAVQLNWMSQPALPLGLLGFALLVGLLAGSYPAFFLSRFRPVEVLKQQFPGSSHTTLLLRKGLVVLQFSISIALIIGTLTIAGQLDFLRSKKLGIETEYTLIVPMSGDSTINFYKSIKAELLSHPQVTGVTASNKRMTRRLSSFLGYKIEGLPDDRQDQGIRTVTVDQDFFNVYGVNFVEGRNFSDAYSTDLSEAFILNESAVRELGLASPVGKRVETSTLNKQSKWIPKQGRVIGVVEDFHFESLNAEIAPVVFHLSEEWLNWISIRIRGEDIPAALAHVEEVHDRFEGGYPFRYTFLDEDLYALYQSEERFMKIFMGFAGMAIFIACLGILGLASFTAERRTKEIGIRKVLGATVTDIMGLLTREFVVLVLFAALIGCPAAWYFIQDWLSGFAYRNNPGLLLFLGGVALAMGIALLSVSFQSLKAAMANPVDSLKEE